MNNGFDRFFDKLNELIELNLFEVPINQPSNAYYPDFLKTTLNNYLKFYQKELSEIIKNLDISWKNKQFPQVETLVNGLITTIDLFYQGKILDATQEFNQTLEKVHFKEIIFNTEIEKDRTFFRSRKPEKAFFTKSDLFHVKFEDRYKISTNRYSVSGYPCLYLGDSTYVCWKEFDEYDLKSLWFSRVNNTRKLKIIRIERIHDFLKELTSVMSLIL